MKSTNTKTVQINSQQAAPQKLRAEPGQALSLVIDGVPFTGQKQINGKAVKLVRKGRALELHLEGQDHAAAVIENIYAESAPIEQIMDADQLLAEQGALTADQPLAGQMSEADVHQATTWSTPVVQGPLHGTQWAQAAASTQSDAGAATTAAPNWGAALFAFGTMGILASNSSSAPAQPEAPLVTVTGQFMAGPVLRSHGLRVQLFQADGTTPLGEPVTINAQGMFTATFKNYTGVVIAKVIPDADAEHDYTDEALGTGKDLDTELKAAGEITAGTTTITLNINPLTTVAVQKMGTNPTAATVASVNAQVAQAFGLTDPLGLTGIPVTPAVAGSTYNSADGLTQSELYGAVLAALSGQDKINGSTQTTITKVVNGLTGAALNDNGQRALLEGIAAADATVNEKVSGNLQTALLGALATVPTDVAALNAVQLTPFILAQLTSDQAAAIAAAGGFAELTGAQVAQLQPAAIDSVPNAVLDALTAAQVAALSNEQLAALSDAQVALLDLSQINSAQAAAMATAGNLDNLTSAQVQSLQPAAIDSVPNAVLDALTAAQVAAMSPTQLGSFSDAQVALLNLSLIDSAQAQAMATAGNLDNLSAAQVQSLRAEAIGSVPAIVIDNLIATEISSATSAAADAASAASAADIAKAHAVANPTALSIAAAEVAQTAATSAAAAATATATAAQAVLSSYTNVPAITSAITDAINNANAKATLASTAAAASETATDDAIAGLLTTANTAMTAAATAATNAATAATAADTAKAAAVANPTAITIAAAEAAQTAATNAAAAATAAATAAQTALTNYTSAAAAGAESAADTSAITDAITNANAKAGLANMAAANCVQPIALAKITAYADNSSTNTAPDATVYQNAGILGVTPANVSAVNAKIDAANAAGANEISEIQFLANAGIAAAAALLKITTYAQDGTQAAPTVVDYSVAGILNVTDANLTLVNVKIDSVAGADATTTAQVQGLVAAAISGQATSLAKITAYATSNSNTAPELNDYIGAGILNVTATNLADVNAQVDAATGSSDAGTLAQVQALANAGVAIRKVALYAADPVANAIPTVEDYTAIGVTGVNSTNLFAINAQVDAKTLSTEADTKAKIQALVTLGANAQTAALSKIAAYAGNSTNPVPDASDYATAGITGVTNAKLAAINAAMDNQTSAQANTVAKVQSYVNILQEANGNAADATPADPSYADYTNVGVAGITSTLHANLMTDVIKNLSVQDVDSVVKLQAYADIVNRVFNQAAGTILTLTIDDLAQLGVTSSSGGSLSALNSAQQQAILAAITGTINDGSGADSIAKLQAIVNAAAATMDRILAEANGPAPDADPNSNPSTQDYVSVGLSDINTAPKAALLTEVIQALNPTDIDSSAKLQAYGDAVAHVFNQARNTNPALTIADLTQLGITASGGAALSTLTAAQQDSLLLAIAATADDGSQVSTIAAIQAVVNTSLAGLATITAYTGSNTAPGLADYTNAGVTGVTNANLAAINDAIATQHGAAADSAPEIQRIVDAYKRLMAEANGVAADATPGVDPSALDYQQIGVNLNAGASGASTNASTDAETLALLNSVIAAKDASAIGTVAAITALASIVNRIAKAAALASATGADATTLGSLALTDADFAAIGINNVTSANVANVLAAIALTADSGSAISGLTALQTVVNNANSAITALGNYTGAEATPTATTYLQAGVSGVNNTNLAAVNSALARLSVGVSDTSAKVQAVVDTYNKILAEANGTIADATPSANPLTTDYGLVGVDLDKIGATITPLSTNASTHAQTLSLLNDALANQSTASVNSIAKLESLVSIVNRIAQTAADGTPTQALTPADFALLGIGGVDNTNLASILAGIANTNNDLTGVNSLASLQAIASTSGSAEAVALNTIVSYANDAANPAPIVADYTLNGVSGVDTSNFQAVNSALDALTGTDVNTAPKVQAVVSAYQAILAEANGAASDLTPNTNPTALQYSTIGANLGTTGSTNAADDVQTLALLNDVIANRAAADVDTVAEINTLASIVNRIAAIAALPNTTVANISSTLTANDFALIGIKGVTEANLTTVLAGISTDATATGTGTDSLLELQSIVSQVVAQDRVTQLANGAGGGYVINFDDPGFAAGPSLGTLGDINNDGLIDIGTAEGDQNQGAALLIYGRTETSPLSTTNINNGVGGVRLLGTTRPWATQIFGTDINADGRIDIDVNAADGHYTFYGTGNWNTNTSTAALAADTANSLKSRIVSPNFAEDINGDGYNDLAFVREGGQAYVLFGGPNPADDATPWGQALPTGTGFRITGATTNWPNFYGAATGDFNGDGYTDIVMTGQNGQGAYVVFGKAGMADVDINNLSANSAGYYVNVTPGQTAVTRQDFSIAALGDVNGDGISDFAVGNRAGDAPIAIVFGRSTGGPGSLQEAINGVGGFGITIGMTQLDAVYAINNIASAGDVNGDGLADILVGYLKGNGGLGNTGFTSVVYGKADNTTSVRIGDLVDGVQGFTLMGSYDTGYGSTSGDFNGDGLSDIATTTHINTTGAIVVAYGGQQGNNKVTYQGGTGNDTLVGTTAAETFAAGQGDDVLVAGGGTDVLYGGAGNDTVVVNSSTIAALGQGYDAAAGRIARIDGGTGYDTLRVAEGANLDLTGIGNTLDYSRIESIERIDLATDTAANVLTLTATDVVAMGIDFNLHNNANGWTDGTYNLGSGVDSANAEHRRQLVVEATSADTLSLLSTATSLWSNAGTVFLGSKSYTVYNNSGVAAQILADSRIQVTQTITGVGSLTQPQVEALTADQINALNLAGQLDNLPFDLTQSQFNALSFAGIDTADKTALFNNVLRGNASRTTPFNMTAVAAGVQAVQEAVNGGPLTVANLQALGITTATNVTIDAIKARMDATNNTVCVNSVNEIKALIANASSGDFSGSTDTQMLATVAELTDGAVIAVAIPTHITSPANTSLRLHLPGTGSGTNQAIDYIVQQTDIDRGYALVTVSQGQAQAAGDGIKAVTYDVLQNGSATASNLPVDNFEFRGTGLAPALFTPLDSTYFAVERNLSINFNKAVTKGMGAITLYKMVSGNPVLVESFDVESSTTVTGWNTQALTINPTNDLLSSTDYYVTIAAGALQDAYGNPYAGITSNTGWHFTGTSVNVSVDAVATDNVVNIAEKATGTLALGGTFSSTDAALLQNFDVSHLTVTLKAAGQPDVVGIVSSYNNTTGAWTGTVASTSLQDNTAYTVQISLRKTNNDNTILGADAVGAAFTTDLQAPIASVATGTVPGNGLNGSVSVISSEQTGTVYLVSTSVTVNALSDITNAASNQKASASVGASISTSALALGTYKAYAVDAAGNLSAAPSTGTVTINVIPSAVDLAAAPSIQNTATTYFNKTVGMAAGGLAIFADVQASGDAHIAKIQIGAAGAVTDTSNDQIKFGSQTLTLNTTPSNGSSVVVAGTELNWSYTNAKVLTLTKTNGDNFTSEEALAVEKSLLFNINDYANAAQGNRTFTLQHFNKIDSAGALATQTVSVDTIIPGQATSAPTVLLTNTMAHSDDFSRNVTPVNTSYSLTLNNATDPSGGNTADTIRATTNGDYTFRRGFLNETAGETYTGSYYLKLAPNSIAQKSYFGIGSSAYSYNFSTKAFEFYGVPLLNYSVSEVGDGWHRFSLSYFATQTRGVVFDFYGIPVGNTLPAWQFWGAQFETGLGASPYIATGNSAVTADTVISAQELVSGVGVQVNLTSVASTVVLGDKIEIGYLLGGAFTSFAKPVYSATLTAGQSGKINVALMGDSGLASWADGGSATSITLATRIVDGAGNLGIASTGTTMSIDLSASDTINGWVTNDVIRGGGGIDTINLGSATVGGSDTLLYKNGADLAAQDVVNNFTVGNVLAANGSVNTQADVIKFVDAFSGFNLGGASTAAAKAAALVNGGWVKLEQSGSDVIVSVDADGGGNGWSAVANLKATTLAGTAGTTNIGATGADATALATSGLTNLITNGQFSIVQSNNVVAGPAMATMSFALYDTAGNLLKSGSTDAAGNFNTDGIAYRGNMLVVIKDANGSAADYKDEFSGQDVDLSTDLRAVVNFTGPETAMSITPLTELATRLLGVAAGSTAASASTQVQNIYDALETAFGVPDLLTKATAVNDASASSNTYGKMLGALSLMDTVFGDMNAALDALARGITLTTDGSGNVTGASLNSNLQALLTLGNTAMTAYETAESATAGTAAVKTAAALLAAKNSLATAGVAGDWLATGSVTGTAGDDKIFALAGNDTITHTTGNDLVFGGAGLDTYTLGSTANQTVNLGNLYGVEQVDLTGAGDNTLNLSLASVLNNGATGLFAHGSNGWNFNGITTAGKVQLLVDGDAGDSISKSDSTTWSLLSATASSAGHTYAVYESILNGVTAQLLVDQSTNRVL